MNEKSEKTIVVKHKTRCEDTPQQIKGEENPCKEFTTTFDFSNCDNKEILELAARTCIIAFRTKSKVNSITEERFSELMTEPIDVHEALKAERKGMTAEEKITKLTGLMNDKEIAALIEKLSNKRT